MPVLKSQDPDDNLDYQFNWASWLPSGDTISSFQIISDDEITVSNTSNTDTVVTVWLSGGTAGQYYTVTCRVVTAGGRTKDQTLRLAITSE